MPTPTPKSRMTLSRLARHSGLRKIQKVDYTAKKAQPAAQQDRHQGAYDLQARTTVIDLYRRRKAASPKPILVTTIAGQVICRDIARQVFVDKQQDPAKRKVALQFVKRWAGRWEKDCAIETQRNAKGAGGARATHKNPCLSPAAKAAIKRALKTKTTRTLRRTQAALNASRIRMGKKPIKSKSTIENVARGAFSPFLIFEAVTFFYF